MNDYLNAGGSDDSWGSKEVQVPGLSNTQLRRSRTAIQGTTPVWQKVTVDDAVINYIGDFATNNAAIQAINTALIQSGMVKPGADLAQFSTAYKTALTYTAKMNVRNPNASVFEAMQLLGGGATTSGGSGSGGTYKDVIRYTDEQVRQKAVSAYQAILGITPDEQQIVEFSKALRAGALAAPSVQKVSGDGRMRETTKGFDERAFIAGFMSNKIPTAEADLGGAAGGIQDLIDRYRQEYGVNPTAGFVQNAIKRIVSAEDVAGAQADLEAQLKEQAQILYPALKDKISAGISVRAIADPYISTFSKIMEKSDLNVGLDNKFISEALSAKNDKGEYQVMDRTEFAKKLRSTDEWLNTRNAKETMLSAADGILKQFGFKR